MKLERIAIVGGGPGGLYAARLLKLANPEADVVVHERGAAHETFGFGVGIAPATQRNLADADAATFDDIVADSLAHDMAMQVGDGFAVARVGELRAIGRSTLLAVLQRHARAAGVRLQFHSKVRASELDAELVIAADGVSSATREELASELGAHVQTSPSLYLWCGTEFALPHALFAPVHTEHGTFVTHAYPYAPDRSTFLIETDEEAWRHAGFDRAGASLGEGESDEVSLRYLEHAFSKQLGGRRLIGNRTRWLRFRTVRCERWHHGNIVLLGDAAHTAHYSIGSGTKLAMEDAIALRQALDEATSLEDALGRYETMRRPAVERLQDLARMSEAWWDTFPDRLSLPLAQLFVAYMTRTGKVPLERFASVSPEIVRAALTSFAGIVPTDQDDIVSWTLAQPLQAASFAAARRELPAAARAGFVELDVANAVTSPSLVARATELARTASTGLWLSGSSERSHVLERLSLGERVKRATDTIVVVEAPAACRGDLAAGLVSGRVDLVCVEEGR